MMGKYARNIMSRKVATTQDERGFSDTASLYAADGSRKYLNPQERQQALAVMASLTDDKALFALTLAWTGARVSEILALTARHFQVEAGLVSLVTLKRRRHAVREIPLPAVLMQALEAHFHLSAAQSNTNTAARRLWPWHRATAWRLIHSIMTQVQLGGIRASPRGLRHGFGIAALQSGVPLNIIQRWLGHARISTTAIYADALGPEERALAEKFWRQ